MFLVGDVMNALQFFKYMFTNFVNLLSTPFTIAPNISVSIFGVAIGVIIIGIFTAVVRRVFF